MKGYISDDIWSGDRNVSGFFMKKAGLNSRILIFESKKVKRKKFSVILKIADDKDKNNTVLPYQKFLLKQTWQICSKKHRFTPQSLIKQNQLEKILILAFDNMALRQCERKVINLTLYGLESGKPQDFS